ncbi:Tetracycline repressor protein class H [Corynebacterium glaucum]|nr:Tetracycline repressor protein class H [Corynebacterium glaucum]
MNFTIELQWLSMQLSREAIVDTALDILSQYGLADVSMRRIAGVLGVAPGALYWHIENKQELIAALADAIIAPVVTAPPEDPEALCAALWDHVLTTRDGAEIVISAIGQPDAPVRRTLEETFASVVRKAAPKGASISDATVAANGLLHLTLGAAAVQQSATQLATATGERGLRPVDEAAAEHAAAVKLLLTGMKC